MFSPYILSPVF